MLYGTQRGGQMRHFRKDLKTATRLGAVLDPFKSIIYTSIRARARRFIFFYFWLLSKATDFFDELWILVHNLLTCVLIFARRRMRRRTTIVTTHACEGWTLTTHGKAIGIRPQGWCTFCEKTMAWIRRYLHSIRQMNQPSSARKAKFVLKSVGYADFRQTLKYTRLNLFIPFKINPFWLTILRFVSARCRLPF